MKAPWTKAIIDFLVPDALRRRMTPDPDLNDSTLGRLNDVDPVYRCLMDMALEGIEVTLMDAAKPSLTDAQRAFACGALSGLIRYVQTIETRRNQARETTKDRMKGKKQP